MKKNLLITLLFLFSLLSAEIWLPCPKPLSGHIESSAGIHFWNDHLYLRNLQIRSLFYLYPGIRLNTIIRGNNEINLIEIEESEKPVYYKIKPLIDEGYLELFGHFYNNDIMFSNSLRAGKVRYLRFPYYGLISRFDQVAGMSDLRQDYEDSGYNGMLYIFDLSYLKVVGWHNTLYLKKYNINNLKELESYIYLRYENSWLGIESRAGRLIVRDHNSDKVAEESDWGWCAMAGPRWRGYDINIYFEKVKDTIYTGLSIKFASSLFTRAAGKIRLDYNRACEGFIIQYPFFYSDLNISKIVPANKKKVGEIRAERVIAFWRIGMQRNFYEHIISRTGITDHRNTEVVIRIEPMLLGIESIISPVYKFSGLDDFKKWDTEGIRPGQLTQIVIYEFYQ